MESRRDSCGSRATGGRWSDYPRRADLLVIERGSADPALCAVPVKPGRLRCPEIAGSAFRGEAAPATPRPVARTGAAPRHRHRSREGRSWAC